MGNSGCSENCGNGGKEGPMLLRKMTSDSEFVDIFI